MANVTIVVLTKDRLDCTQRFLQTLYEYTDYPFDLLIIDNGSDSDTTDYLRNFEINRNNVKIIFSNKNLGVARGRNLAFKQVTTKYLASFDSDMVFYQSNWLKNLINCIETNAADASYPILRHLNRKIWHGKTCICSNNEEYWIESTKETGRDAHVNFLFGGACVMKTTLFRNVGAFAEVLADYEDIDFSLRAMGLNPPAKFMFCSKSNIIHDHREARTEKDREYEKVRYNLKTLEESNQQFIKIWGKSILRDVEREWISGWLGKLKCKTFYCLNTKGDKENNPMISVIIPTYNRLDMLKEAVASVLSQTYQNFEILVVNDAGEDVKAILDSLNNEGKIVYLQHEHNKGLSAARNTALNAARGEYIAYLDDDEVYYPDHLETLVGFLEKSNYKVAYTGSCQAFQTWATDRYVTTKKIIYSYDFDRRRLLIGDYIPLLSVVHRKDTLEDVGLFDENLNSNEDWDMLIRLSQHGDFYHIKAVTAEFRTRDDGTNMTTRNPMAFLKTLRVIHSRYSHLVTDPRVLEDQKNAEETFLRKVESGKKHSSIVHYERMHRYKFAKEFVKGKKVLDLACGSGYGSSILSEEAEYVTGIDINEKSIRYTSSKYVNRNLDFIKGLVTEVPIRGGTIFDVIICFEALEHVEDYDKLMKEVKRLIKDGGIFIVSMSNSKKPYFDEFRNLITNNFKNLLIYGQKVYPVSNIFSVPNCSNDAKDFLVGECDRDFLCVPSERRDARYFIAVSSDQHIRCVTGNSCLLDAPQTLFKQKDAYISVLEIGTKERDAYIGTLEAAINEKNIYISTLEATLQENGVHIGKLNNSAKEMDAYIGTLEAAINEKNIYISTLEATLQERDALIVTMTSTLGWRALEKFRKIRNKLLP